MSPLGWGPISLQTNVESDDIVDSDSGDGNDPDEGFSDGSDDKSDIRGGLEWSVEGVCVVSVASADEYEGKVGTSWEVFLDQFEKLDWYVASPTDEDGREYSWPYVRSVYWDTSKMENQKSPLFY